MLTVKPFLTATLIAVALPAAGAEARPSMRDVPEIEDGLFAVAIADKVRDECSSISARMLRAYMMLQRLKSRANELGYSDEEIRAYVESDTEKARMRAKGEAFLIRNGVALDNPASFCDFGHREIAKNSAIGALLRAK